MDHDEQRLRTHREQRELASFYQEQINHLATPIIQAFTALPLLISVLALFFSVSKISETSARFLIMFTVVAGGLLMAAIAGANQKAARRVQARYLEAHRELFGEAEAFTLVGLALGARSTGMRR